MPTACNVEDCRNESARGGLCWSHIKRKQRDKPVSEPLREYGMTAERRVLKAAGRYADAEGDDEQERARRLLEKYRGKAPRVRVSRIVEEVLRRLGHA